MKKDRKHQFVHVDPEKVLPKISTDKKSAKKEPAQDNVAPFVYRDLLRTTYTIVAFVLVLALLYLIQVRTGLLAPITKKFGF